MEAASYPKHSFFPRVPKAITMIRKALKMLWLIVLIVTPPASAFIPAGQNRLWAIASPAYLLFVGKLLYDHSDQFYLFWTRFLLQVSNTAVSWSISLRIEGELNSDTLDTLHRAIKDQYPDANLWESTHNSRIIHMPAGYVIRLSYASDIDAEETLLWRLHFDISELTVPFRHGEKSLEEIVGIIDGIILPAIPNGRQRYGFRVNFTGPNPYFGLFVRNLRLPEQQLRSFICEFVETAGPRRATVTVEQNRLNLSTDTLPSLQALSRRYITLASLDLTTP